MAENQNDKDAHLALAELRKEVEKTNADLGKIDKLEEILDKQQKNSQELTTSLEAKETARQELEADTKSRIEFLEALISKGGNGAGADEVSAELKAMDKFLRTGVHGLGEEELKYLRSDVAADGGILAPAEFLREIVKPITEISPMRQIARVRTASAGKMELPVRNTLVSAEWEGEGETGTDDNSKYGLEKIPVNKLTVTVPITIEELADSAFDMEAEISGDIVESFNQKEGGAFISGSGFKQPEGILTNTDLTGGARVSGKATEIQMDALLLLAGDLKTGYTPVYLMNRRTTATIRTLKDGVGQYLWQVGNIAAGIPNTLNGFPLVETPDMDDIGANTFPVAFGDFRMGYLIGDSLRMDIIRDPFSLKKSGKVEFTFTRRVGGQVVNAEAIKLLKIST